MANDSLTPKLHRNTLLLNPSSLLDKLLDVGGSPLKTDPCSILFRGNSGGCTRAGDGDGLAEQGDCVHLCDSPHRRSRVISDVNSNLQVQRSLCDDDDAIATGSGELLSGIGSLGISIVGVSDAAVQLQMSNGDDLPRVAGAAHSCSLLGDQLRRLAAAHGWGVEGTAGRDRHEAAAQQLQQLRIRVAKSPGEVKLGIKLVCKRCPPAGLFVLGLVPGGPAARDGRIRPGDRVLEINGADTRHCSHTDAAWLIELSDTVVTMLVQRPPQPPAAALLLADSDSSFWHHKAEASVMADLCDDAS